MTLIVSMLKRVEEVLRWMKVGPKSYFLPACLFYLIKCNGQEIMTVYLNALAWEKIKQQQIKIITLTFAWGEKDSKYYQSQKKITKKEIQTRFYSMPLQRDDLDTLIDYARRNKNKTRCTLQYYNLQTRLIGKMSNKIPLLHFTSSVLKTQKWTWRHDDFWVNYTLIFINKQWS